MRSPRNPRIRERLAAIEQRATEHLFRFTLPGGLTTTATVEQVLDTMTGGPLPPHLAHVTGTPETGDLPRSLVVLARREATP